MTTVCTVGTGVPLLVERLDSAKERGSLVTQPDMRLRDNEVRMGDRRLRAHRQRTRWGVVAADGSVAERQGRQVAENIVRAMRESNPAVHRPSRSACSVRWWAQHGREILGRRISGFVAWFLWRSVYLFELPSWSRRA